MDLYFALTHYHVLCAIVHKLKCNDQEGVFLISSANVNSERIKQNAEKLRIFKKVGILKHEVPLMKKVKGQNLEDSNYIDKIIDDYRNLFVKALPIELSDFENLYIWADHFPIGIYLNSCGIEYNYFEDGCGQMSRVNETISNLPPIQREIVERLRLFGQNGNVQKRFINFEAQSEDYTFSEKDVDFPINKYVAEFSDEEKKQILDIFGVPKLSFETDPEDSILYCPQHNVNLEIFSIEQQIYQTALLIDYFANGANVYIKQHPNDVFTDYRELGRKVNIIPGAFPSELLLVCTSGKFQKGITAWSTSIRSLGPILNKTVCFASSIDKDFYALHRYYAACRMLCTVINEKTILYTIGANNEILDNMLHESDIDRKNASFIIRTAVDLDFAIPCNSGKEKFAILVDDLSQYSRENVNKIRNAIFASNAELIVFINSREDYVFFDGTNQKIIENMARWVILKKLFFEPTAFSEIACGEEDIWIYMKSKEKAEMVSELSFEKELPYSKMMLKVNLPGGEFMSSDADQVYRNMKMMEGILNAMEKRVLEEISQNHVLEGELDNLRGIADELRQKLKRYEGDVSELDILQQENERLVRELEILEQRAANERLMERIEELKHDKIS